MNADFFSHNRSAFSTLLKGGVAVLAGNTSVQRSNDMAYSFTQEANFYYLTGIRQADWKVIIEGASGRTTLVSPIVESVHALFDGTLPPEEALRISGADRVIDQHEAAQYLRTLAKKHSIVYSLTTSKHAAHYNFSLNPAELDNIRMLERVFGEVQDCRNELTSLRVLKQPEEIKAMQKAVDLTIVAFERVKSDLVSYVYEYEIEADMTHTFRSHGSDGHAYDPIIASGSHACTLHYGANNDKLASGKLILLDVGASYQAYCADITRTYSKKQPTKRQAEIHLCLQHAQSKIIDLLAPGVLLSEYSKSVDEIMKQTLMSLKLLKSMSDEDTYRTYFPHAIGHGLGIDTHDSLGQPRVFQPGMVITVEPGIYIPEEGIGLRIEDDILITERGYKNLSAKLSTSW